MIKDQIDGWSLSLQYERSCRLDLPGCDFIMDLVSILEAPPLFPPVASRTLLSIDSTNPIPTSRMESIAKYVFVKN